MKNILLFVAIFCCTIAASAQHFQWTERSHGSGVSLADNEGSSVDVDDASNVYVGGMFSSFYFTLDGASGSLGFQTSGFRDMFIAKYSPAGNLLWLGKPTGVSVSISSVSVTVDKVHQSLYVTGAFSAGSDSLNFNSHLLRGNGGSDVFVVRYDFSGNVIWAKSFGGGGTDYPNCIKADANGNVYVAGGFSSDSIRAGSSLLINAGATNFFVAKYDSSGNLVWMKGGGGNSTDQINAIAIDNAGFLYTTGSFSSYNLSFNGSTIASTGGWDMFIAKYDTSGNEKWIKSATGTLTDGGTSIQMLKSGRILAGGVFSSPSLGLGTATLTNSLPASYRPDIFLFKIDTAGNVIWSARAGGEGEDVLTSITADSLDNVFVSGWFRSSGITFGATTHTRATPLVGTSLFLAKMDSTGNFVWSTSVGEDNANVLAYSMVVASNGSVYATGSFGTDTVSFGDSTFYWTGGNEVFVSKLDQAPLSVRNDTKTGFQISLHPNPCTNTCRLSSSDKIYDIKIVDALGKTVYADSPKANIADIDVSSLPTGIYFVVVNNKVVIKACRQ